jgi:hypothetical protein
MECHAWSLHHITRQLFIVWKKCYEYLFTCGYYRTNIQWTTQMHATFQILNFKRKRTQKQPNVCRVTFGLTGETEVLGGGGAVPVPLCPPQILHGVTRDRTRASAVGGRRVTAWVTARLIFGVGITHIDRSTGDRKCTDTGIRSCSVRTTRLTR